MEIKQSVVNLELSKKIEKLGVKQDSLWWWFVDGCEAHSTLPLSFYLAMERINENDYKYYSAFTVAELGEMLPESCWSKSGETISALEISKTDGKWWISYNDEFIQADTEANARAKMLIHLIENKLMEVK